MRGRNNLKLIHQKHNPDYLAPVKIYFELDKNSYDNLSPAIDTISKVLI